MALHESLTGTTRGLGLVNNIQHDQCTVTYTSRAESKRFQVWLLVYLYNFFGFYDFYGWQSPLFSLPHLETKQTIPLPSWSAEKEAGQVLQCKCKMTTYFSRNIHLKNETRWYLGRERSAYIFQHSSNLGRAIWKVQISNTNTSRF